MSRNRKPKGALRRRAHRRRRRWVWFLGELRATVKEHSGAIVEAVFQPALFPQLLYTVTLPGVVEDVVIEFDAKDYGIE